MSWATRNVRTREFREMYERLPAEIRKTCRLAFRAFLRNPDHPALRRHPLGDSDRGRHRGETWSVSVTMKYRALYTVDGDTNVWYWVGSHNDYENFIGRK
jgi:hypothetical protein